VTAEQEVSCAIPAPFTIQSRRRFKMTLSGLLWLMALAIVARYADGADSAAEEPAEGLYLAHLVQPVAMSNGKR
jgi:hypothetical protein